MSALSNHCRRFTKFCLVGGTGVFVDMGMLFLLADPQMLGWGITVSKALAAETAIVNNFLWNELWTFRDVVGTQTGISALFKRFTRFNFFCLAGIALNILLLHAQVRWLAINLYAANLIAIVIVAFWNYFLNVKFAWNTSTTPDGPSPNAQL